MLVTGVLLQNERSYQVNQRSHCILHRSVPGCTLVPEAIMARASAHGANPWLSFCVPSSIDRYVFLDLEHGSCLTWRRGGYVHNSGLPMTVVGRAHRILRL